MQRIQRGEALKIEDLQKQFAEVKGSINDFIERIRSAFYKLYRDSERAYYWIQEVFTDHLIVSSNTLPDGEFYKVNYSVTEDATGIQFAFTPIEQWERVELAYQPSTTPRVPPLPAFASVQTASAPDPAAKKTKFVESVAIANAELVEETQAGKTRRKLVIREAVVADVVNRNKRRYSLPVVKAAVEEIRQHLHESAGQGRLLLTSTGDQLVGEAEHPSDKASGRPNLLETVVKWENVSLDESSGAVTFEGTIIETSKGKDILALLEGGVRPGGSLRGYGYSRTLEEAGQSIEEVTELHFTGYDLVSTPGFSQAQAVLESKLDEEDQDMDPKKLLEMLQGNPELATQLKTMLGVDDLAKASVDQMKLIETEMRRQLGINEGADLFKTLGEAMKAKATLDGIQAKAAKDAAIAEACKDLKFGALNAKFAEELAETCESAEGVPAAAKRLAERYGALVANTTLADMGFQPGRTGGAGVQVLGPVIEREGNTPAFATASFHFSESLAATYPETINSFKKGAQRTKNERFAMAMLERFDARFKRELMLESQQFDEASAVADLNLPYSINRAIVQRLLPQLIALSVYDTAPMANQTELLWYESYSAETGLVKTITDEVVAASLGNFVALGAQRLNPGTVVLTHTSGTPTYVEGTDYAIDYANGMMIALTGGTITNAQSLKIDYDYMGIRMGESQPIERAKMTLASKSVTAKADRLATEISTEAMLFSRSQLGYDLSGRTIANLIAEIRRKIDGDLFRLGIAKMLSVASNSGGTWSASGADYADLVKKIGVARVKLTKRYYQPTAILMSEANADAIANWSGFTQAGARPDSDINAEGYVGRLKSLPVFRSTEFPDSYIQVLNRELVAYRVFRGMELKGPFPRYEGTTGKLIANDQWYVEEFNASDAPLADKASYIVVT